MNIAVITPTYLPIVGGAEIGIFEIYKRLSSRHKVHIIVPVVNRQIDKLAQEDPYFEESSISISRYEERKLFDSLPNVLAGRIGRIFPDYSVASSTAIDHVIRNQRIDVVNCHYLFPNLGVLSHIRKRHRLPIMLSIVGREFDDSFKLLGKTLARYAVSKVQKVAYISSYLRNLAGAPRDDDAIIYYGVDLERYAPGPTDESVRRMLDIPPSYRVLLAVQRLDRVKRIEILLEAFSLVLRTFPDSVLAIVGAGGDSGRLREHAEVLGIDRNIRWCGYIRETELPCFYRAADLVVFHSLNETFGVVVAQAMACGRPLVTVNSTALTELVQHGVNGLLAKQNDPVDFAQKICEALKDREMSEHCSNNARAFAEKHFSWEHISREFEKNLNQIKRGET